MQNTNSNKPNLASIPLEQVMLADTWLAELLTEAGNPMIELPPYPDWHCAINREHRVLFTQLVSDTASMRDGDYTYLLAIGEKLVLIAWHDKACLGRGAYLSGYSAYVLRKLADRGAQLVTYDKKPFVWSDM